MLTGIRKCEAKTRTSNATLEVDRKIECIAAPVESLGRRDEHRVLEAAVMPGWRVK
jgi:hypothetical protein